MVACLVAAILAPGTAGAAWKAGAERYDVGIDRSVAIEMRDGTKLYADVYYPVDPDTGERARGSFPVVMNMTPYGKRSLEFVGQQGVGGGGSDAGLSRTMPELVRRGYINVIADIRGTGRSEGAFKLLEPQQGRDGAEVVRWAAKLPQSSGKVGLYGPSYMALIQYFTAANLPKGSPLRAMLPVVVPNSPYRELATMGGIVAGEADIPLFAVFVTLPLIMPLIDDGWSDPAGTLAALARNVPSLTEGLAPLGAGVINDGDEAYDQQFWKRRAPAEVLRRVTGRKIPTLSVGGWRDVFQRGTLMNFAGHQNAWAGRNPARPMRPRQKVTSRYQAIQGDWTHVNGGAGIPLGEIAHRWFDAWLKNRKGTGVRKVKRPLRLFDMTRKRWVETRRYPFAEARAKSFYLGGAGSSGAPSANDGVLVRSRPGSGSDTLAFTGVSSPCSGNADQYALGVLTLGLESLGLSNPCVRDDRSLQIGPGALTYTTAPMGRARTLAGPIGARIYATSTRPEVSLIATLSDVSPDGSSRYLTSGALLGSHRALNRRRSWMGRRGEPVLPYHPHTRAAREPVPAGELVRYDLEIFPVLATLDRGHRLRLTLTSVDTPHLTPTPDQMAGLVGGVYGIERGGVNASRLTVPITAPGKFRRGCRICK